MASVIERHVGGCSSKIDILWRQVVKTFNWTQSGTEGLCNSPAVSYDDRNFAEIKRQVDAISAEDIALEASLLEMKQHPGFRNEEAVGNFVICGNDSATMQVFILHRGQQMPIHDHPNMVGILKVIKGCVRVHSYTLKAYERRKPGSSILQTVKQTLDVCKGDPACVLTPSERNFHSIMALNGEAAFLDILSPPYFSNVMGHELNVCNYYREAELLEAGNVSQDLVKLEEIPPPEDYWTVKGEYKGPPISQYQSSN